MSIDESLQTQQFSPGEKLASARKALGLTLEEVAQALKITSHFVRAIERDEYHRLPGDTFAKGYLRLYAELLSLDAEPLVAGMQELVKPESVHKAPLIPQVACSKRGVSKLTLVAVLLLAGGGYWWWQTEPAVLAAGEAESNASASSIQGVEPIADGLHLPADNEASPVLSLVEQLDTELEQRDSTQKASGDSPTAVAGSALGESDPVSTDSASDHIGPVEIVVPAERSLGHVPSTSEPDTSAEGGALASEPQAEQVANPGEAESASNAVVATGLSVAFNEDCWLKISNSKGQELFSGVKAAGSTLELDIEKPFQIRFGNAPGVGAIHYQQQPLALDLKPGRSVAVLHVN